MDQNEWLTFISETLGRQVGPDDEISFEDFKAISAAEAEKRWAETQENKKAEQAEAERQAKLEADPLFEKRERAAELRAEAEERAKLVADARLIAADKLKDHFPADFIEGLSDDEAITAAFNEQGDPYTITDDRGNSFVVDPKDSGKPSAAPQTLAERQAAYTAHQEAKERAQWNGGNEDA